MTTKTLQVSSNERVDLEDFLFAVDESLRANARQAGDQLWADPARATRSWVVSGFGTTSPAASQVQVTRGRAILAQREVGQVYYGSLVSEGELTRIVDVSGYADGTYGVYIRFELVDGETESRAFWEPSGLGTEIAQTISTRRLASWSVRIELTLPGAEWLQVATVAVASGIVGTITDTRGFYFEGTVPSTYASGWSTDGGGVSTDRNADRITYGAHDLHTFLAAMRQCLEDIKGRGLRRWWSRDIGGMNIGFDAAPVEDRLAVGDANLSLLLTGGVGYLTLGVDSGSGTAAGFSYNRSTDVLTGTSSSAAFLTVSPTELQLLGAVPASPGAGGSVAIMGGDADTTGAGGAVSLTAGTGGPGGGGGQVTAFPGSTTGRGGDASIIAGTSSAGAVGGGATVLGGIGATTYDGGYAHLYGGDGGPGGGDGGPVESLGGNATGTNKDGGLATLSGGSSTGSGSSSALIQAAEPGGSGTTARAPTDYLKADGALKQLTASKSFVATATDATRAPIRVTPQAATPSIPIVGDLWFSTTTGKPSCYDGFAEERLVPQVYSASVAAGGDPVSGTGGDFATKYTIPAGSLRVGSVIRIRASGTKTGTTGGFGVWIGLKFADGSYMAIAAPPSLGLAQTSTMWTVNGDAVVGTLHASTGRVSGGGMVATNVTGSVFGQSQTVTAGDTVSAVEVVIRAALTSGDSVDLTDMVVDVT